MASYYDRQVHEAAEKLKRSLAAREGRRKRKRRRGPDPRPATIARGEGDEVRRVASLPVYCQHSDDGHKCWNPTLARDPLAKVPACRKHYQRAYRQKTGKR